MTICLAILSSALRVVLAGLVVFMLMHRDLGEILNRRERRGAAIMGGCGFMTIPVIMDINKVGTPFDLVAGLAFTVGAILFLWGFIDRKLGHARRNRQQRDMAASHFASKGQ